MPKATHGRSQPVLAKLFRKAERLAKTDNAVAIGLLCAVAGYVAAGVWGHGPTAFLQGEGAGLGFILGTAAYTLLSPGSRVTACLVSARERFLDGLIKTVKLTYGPTIRWLALDYGCALIKDRAEWSDGKVSEKRLVTLLKGEPAASFFDEPANFKEVPPFLKHGPAFRRKTHDYYAHRPLRASVAQQR